MPRVLVWKCNHTGKLFEDEKKYRVHQSRLARQRREQRKIDIQEDEAEIWWNQFRDTEIDINSLPELIIKEQKHFWAEARKTNSFSWHNVGKKQRGAVMPVPEVVEFTRFDLTWEDKLSNSHSCPMNGVTNWGRKKDLPSGYPGWRGNIYWKIKWPKEWDGWYPGSDLLDGSRVCIRKGSGGGGGYKDGFQSFGYDFKIFADDWPGLKRYREKKLMWKILKGEHVPKG